MNCRLCSHSTTTASTTFNIHGREIIDSSTYQLYFCPHCLSFSLEKVEDRPKYYQQAYNTKYYPSTTLPARVLNFISFTIRRQIILSHFPKSQTKINILDVGCGQGEFLQSLPTNKFNLSGVEINPQAIKLLQKKNIRVYPGNISEINFRQDKFDCITLWHVLEHLPNPQKTLSTISQLLNPGGLILAAVPCSNSIGFKVGKQYCFHLDSPRHLFIPSIKGLKIIFTKAKFKKLSFSNPFYDYPLDLLWSVRKSLLRFIIYPLYPIFKLFSTESILISAKK